MMGCDTGSKQVNSIGTLPIPDATTKTSDEFSYPLFESDSMAIRVREDSLSFSVILSMESEKREFDLTALNIPIKDPVELLWVSEHYACIVTWWSQSQSRHVFIPLNGSDELIYFDKDIERMDSVHDNVIYIDRVDPAAIVVVFKVENLLTRKSAVLELPINEENGVYPFYDQIVLTQDRLTITSASREESVSIGYLSRRY
jgi:hypothetical protein